MVGRSNRPHRPADRLPPPARDRRLQRARLAAGARPAANRKACRMNIALLGLSADPPHLGHLAVAQAVYEEGFDRFWFLITPQNPFKDVSALSYWHRRELARILAEGTRAFDVSDFEAGVAVHDPDLRTHTVLEALHQRMPEVNFTFVMGADAWADEQKGFHTWKNFTGILAFAGLLILQREPWTSAIHTCPAAVALSGAYAPGTGPVPRGKWRVSNQPIDHTASSTEVRKQLALNGTSEHMLPSQLGYLRKHKLLGLGQP
ncbi:MAG: hypothetical protein EOP85_09285 [Verrucomicrobiaceae bacterium]|nr:MAG: hypothetical protein EOP85_09285 [Verrucomicrobiaceae bacterium]